MVHTIEKVKDNLTGDWNLIMAKYSRFDPRNRKKNRHKDRYLGRTQRPVRRELTEEDIDINRQYYRVK